MPTDNKPGTRKIDRRSLLKTGGQAALAGALLGSWLGSNRRAGAEGGGQGTARVLTPSVQTPAVKPKAKKLLFLFMMGGPPQTQTFDPKPENYGRVRPNGAIYDNHYKHAIPTNVPGIEVCESLPMLAKVADKYSIIRSLRGNEGNHGVMMLYGVPGAKEIIRPTPTTIAGIKLADPKIVMPPYILLTEQTHTEVGYLGPQYGPFVTGGDPSQPNFDCGLGLPRNTTVERSRKQRQLLQGLDTLRDERLREASAHQERVFQQVLENSQMTFDLSREKKEVRERYGMNWIGQTCLLSRRLLEGEHGAKVVKINWANHPQTLVGAWDWHSDPWGPCYEVDAIAMFDRACSSLLEDLSQRGMLDETIVLAGGEIGRMPYLTTNGATDRGTDHSVMSFSWLVAGGGFKGGRVVGKTNREGYVTQRPVYPWDLWRSVYALLGINPDDKLPAVPGQCDNAQILPPTPTANQFWLGWGRKGAVEQFKKDKDAPPDIYVAPFLDPNKPVTGGLLTEIM